MLETDGPDELEALDAIVALIGDRFGEGEGRGAATLECPSPRDASLRLF